MFGFKKYFPMDLVQLTIMLSLLRLDPDTYLELEAYRRGGGIMMEVPDIVMGSSSAFIRTDLPNHYGGYDDRFSYPYSKSLDNILLSQSDIFYQLNMLGRYNRYPRHITDFTTYLLDGQNNNNLNSETTNVRSAEEEETNADAAAAHVTQPQVEHVTPNNINGAHQEMSKEDMDLIEILLTQDVDMGVTRDVWELSDVKLNNNDQDVTVKIKEPLENPEDQLQTWSDMPSQLNYDPWAGRNYTIDCETGEHILVDEESVPELNCKKASSSSELSLPNDSGTLIYGINLNSASAAGNNQHLSLEEEIKVEDGSGNQINEEEINLEDSSEIFEQLKQLEAMLQTTQIDSNIQINTNAIMQQNRPLYLRSLSVEQRWQELRNLFSLSQDNSRDTEEIPSTNQLLGHPSDVAFSAMDNGSSVLLQNATLPTAVSEPTDDANLLWNQPSDYSMDFSTSGATASPDNISSIVGLRNDSDFFSSIMDEDDFNLMELAMTDDDILDSPANELMTDGDDFLPFINNLLDMEENSVDSSSDSAVSSMNSSERVSSVSDGDWLESSPQFDRRSNYEGSRQHRYSYAPEMESQDASAREKRTAIPEQRKHQKKFTIDPTLDRTLSSPRQVTDLNFPNLEGATASLDDLTISGFSSAIEQQSDASDLNLPSTFLQQVNHNHTYPMSSTQDGNLYRAVLRDKMKKKAAMEEQLTKDEKRARSLKIPLSISDIVNLPMDEFNELISKYELTEAQHSLIKDIRRRGKNKVAAQNCRKRKLDQILTLAEELQEMQQDRTMTIREQQNLLNERQMLMEKYSQLYTHVFQSLRDPDGNPYSPNEYSLQQSSDGNMLLVPNNSTVPVNVTSAASHSRRDDSETNKGAKSKQKHSRKS